MPLNASSAGAGQDLASKVLRGGAVREKRRCRARWIKAAFANVEGAQ